LLVLGVAFICFLFWPYFIGVFQIVRNSLFKPLLKVLIPLFYFNLLLLGWIGGQPVETLYTLLGQLSIVIYFLFFILFVFFNFLEFYIFFLYGFLKKNKF
jgi:hypothetical protein